MIITGPPSAPEGLRVKNVGKDYADLDWIPSRSDGGSKITAYRVYKSTVHPPIWEEVAKVKALLYLSSRIS